MIDWKETLGSNAPEWLADRTCYVTVTGSRAYGTATEASDVDIRGVAIAPMEHYLGIADSFEQFESSSDDTVIYDIRKFVRLAAQGNPNVLEILFTGHKDRLTATSAGWALWDMRKLFLSKRVRNTFYGYARAQLLKLRQGSSALLLTPREQMTDRQKSIADLGYCGKNAMHMVRLLRMGVEILQHGVVMVDRLDAKELLAIRNGEWSLDKLVSYASEQDDYMGQVARDSYLPEEPDMAEIDRRLVSIIKGFNE